MQHQYKTVYVVKLEHQFIDETNKIDLLVVENFNDVKKVANLLSYFNIDCFSLDDFRGFYGDDLRSYRDELIDIFIELNRYFSSKSKKKLLIAPLRTIINKLPKKELLQSFKLEFTETINQNELK